MRSNGISLIKEIDVRNKITIGGRENVTTTSYNAMNRSIITRPTNTGGICIIPNAFCPMDTMDIVRDTSGVICMDFVNNGSCASIRSDGKDIHIGNPGNNTILQGGLKIGDKNIGTTIDFLTDNITLMKIENIELKNRLDAQDLTITHLLTKINQLEINSTGFTTETHTYPIGFDITIPELEYNSALEKYIALYGMPDGGLVNIDLDLLKQM